MTLNGGQYGGCELDTEILKVMSDSPLEVKVTKGKGATYRLEDASGIWVYDAARHKDTPTADFIGMG